MWPNVQLRHAGPTNVNREAELDRPSRVACSERLCKNSSTTRRAEKATLTFSLWRIFIFSEGDSNHFFVLQND
jgi:hypothetical protein